VFVPLLLVCNCTYCAGNDFTGCCFCFDPYRLDSSNFSAGSMEGELLAGHFNKPPGEDNPGTVFVQASWGSVCTAACGAPELCHASLVAFSGPVRVNMNAWSCVHAHKLTQAHTLSVCVFPPCAFALAAADYSKLVFGPHAGPVVALSMSPFLPELLLSVGDWTFRLWHHGLDSSQLPLFVSPQAQDTYTAGAQQGWQAAACMYGLSVRSWALKHATDRKPDSLKKPDSRQKQDISLGLCCIHTAPAAAWSPSRPGLLFLATSAGTLQVSEAHWGFAVLDPCSTQTACCLNKPLCC
jgi:hypothetical protein